MRVLRLMPHDPKGWGWQRLWLSSYTELERPSPSEGLHSARVGLTGTEHQRTEGSWMHIVVIHSISDPDRFWAADVPEGGPTLHSALPNDDRTRAVCVWEADSLDTVKQLVEGTVGEVSSNEYFEVNAENAQGVPG
jgi:hypothetical protein